MRWHTTSRRIQAHDRRAASVHGAGVSVVARQFGVSTCAWIEPTKAQGADEKTWIGECIIDPSSLGRLSAGRCVMISLAGLVAQCCWTRHVNPQDGFSDYEANLREPYAIPASVWALAGRRPGEADQGMVLACEAMGALLSPGCLLWPTMLRTGRDLIVRWTVNMPAAAARHGRQSGRLVEAA